MDYRYLGNSGLRVSTISLGTMTFGATTHEAAARKIIDVARAKGVNFIDTADAYVGGASEVMLGKLIKKDRNNWVVATKVGQSDGTPERKKGLSKKWMREAIDHSLKSLQTDFVDIYYMHHVDWETPLEESIAAIGEIIASGKALHWGFSNHRAWQIGEMVRLCDVMEVPRPIIAQPLYNMLNRSPENDLLPACELYGIGVVPYSPLARGVLTGKYTSKDGAPKNSRAGRGDSSILNRDMNTESFQAVAKITQHLKDRNIPVSDFAIQWLLNNQLVSSVIAGPRTLSQWNAYLGALKHQFTAEDEAFANTLVASGHHVVPGYTWGRYPVRGRVTING